MTAEHTGPLVLTDATVHLTPTRTVHGDIWTDGRTITHAGAAEPHERPGDARTIDASGASIVPLLVDSALRARPTRARDTYDLAPGNPATFAVTRSRVTESQVRGSLMIRPPTSSPLSSTGRSSPGTASPTPPPR
ncbi:hypothetical protein [Amycolatopsis speibonae]|uniref:Urease accessory protein UreD n=1 Tax=Amycolatopsis speibonae TaxID=1450224 RepID=A0ABV7PA98_9PSEU